MNIAQAALLTDKARLVHVESRAKPADVRAVHARANFMALDATPKPVELSIAGALVANIALRRQKKARRY